MVPFSVYFPQSTVIPKLYWDADSQEQRIHCLFEGFKALYDYVEQGGTEFAEVKKALADLQGEFEKFKTSGFDDYYEVQVIQWISNNLDKVFTDAAKQVYFGLTLDGHFAAYIPDSWSDIQFDTGQDYSLDTYGRLMLRYVTDGEPVDQTPEVRS